MSISSPFHPFFFGKPGRELFGIYHEPDPGVLHRPAVLICGPAGADVTATHRTQRILAIRFAREGFPVLRYDLPGCGDSAGDEVDTTIENCVESVLLAQREIQSRAGSAPVCCLGIRFGGQITVIAAGRTDQPFRALALWDPPPEAIDTLSSPHGLELVVADSAGDLAARVRSLPDSHPLRTATIHSAPMVQKASTPTELEGGALAPAGLVAAIVKHGVRNW